MHIFTHVQVPIFSYRSLARHVPLSLSLSVSKSNSRALDGIALMHTL